MSEHAYSIPLQNHIQAANRHADIGELAAALHSFRAVLALSSDHEPALLGEGRVLQRLKRFPEAQACFERLLLTVSEKNRPHVLIGLGQCLMATQNAAGALPYLEQGLLLSSTTKAARLSLAECLISVGNYERAELLLTQLCSEYPDMLAAHMRRARCVLLRHGAAAALPYFEQAMALAPSEPSPLLAYADALRQANLPEKALAALRAWPASASPVHGFELEMSIARCHQKLGNLSAALPHFRLAFAKAPEQANVGIALAEALLEAGDYAEARRHYELMQKKHPQDVRVFIGMARCIGMLEGAMTALQSLNALPAALRADGMVQLAVADYLADCGEYREALERYQAAERSPAQLARIEMGLARCWRELDGPTKALPHHALAAKYANASWPRLQYAMTLIELDQLSLAEQQLGSMFESMTDRPWARLGFAKILFQQNRPDDAMQTLQEGLAEVPINAAIRLHYADLMRDWGLHDQARACVADLAELDAPESADALASIADTLGAQERFDEALQFYELAQYQQPRKRHDYLTRASQVLRAKGDLRSARDRLEAALQSSEKHTPALLQLSELATEQEDFTLTLKTLQKLLQSPATAPGGPVLLARTLAAMGSLSSALKLLDECQRSWPGRPEIHICRIAALCAAGHLEQARAHAETAAAMFPKHFHLMQTYALCLFSCGDLSAAKQVIGSIQANSYRQKTELAMLRARHDALRWDWAQAQKHYQQALDRQPRHPAALHGLAICELLKGHARTARAHLETLSHRDSLRRIHKGESPNVSQSHMGQLVDEYLIDAPLQHELQEQLKLPPELRLERLSALVREHPGSLAAAAALLASLRQARRLEAGAAACDTTSGCSISLQIVQFWNSESPPPDIQDYMRSWREVNPQLRYHCFNDASARALLEAHYTPRELHAYDSAVEPAKRADYFRLAYLAKFGGFYADADDRCRRPLQGLVDPSCRLLVWQEEYGTIGNNFIGACAGHPVIRRALEDATIAMERGDEDLLWLATGPGLLTRALASHLSLTDHALNIQLAGIFVLTEAELRKSVAIHNATFYKRSGQHWSKAPFRQSATKQSKPLAEAPQ